MRTYAAAVATIVLLAGCSPAPGASAPASTPQPSETTTTSAMPTTTTRAPTEGAICDNTDAGPWRTETADAAIFTITIPGANPLIQQAEAIRKELGVKPVTYVSVQIDNTHGTRDAYLYSLTAVLANGQQVDTEGVLDDWRRMASERDNSPLHNRIIALSNADSSAVPGGKVTTFAIFPNMNVVPQRLHAYINGGFERTEVCRFAE